MSKKKNNQTTESQVVEEKEDVVDTEVVEAPATDTTETPAPEAKDDQPTDDGVTVTTDAPVDDQPATDAPADEVKDDQPADDGVAVTTDAPVDQPATDEAPVSDDSAPTDTPVDTPASDAPADKPADEAKDEKPADKAPATPAKEEKEEKDDAAKQNNVDSTLMNRELMTSYKVRFAFSQSSKKYAAARTMTLYNMIDLFMTNRQGFVGCVEQKDFDHIKDYLLHNPVIYKYQEFKLDGRKQFIERLGTNTDYVIAHLK
jgi:hypothetical protein